MTMSRAGDGPAKAGAVAIIPAMDPIATSEILFATRYHRRPLQWAQRSGLTNGRNLLWSWYEPRNFGDWIGPYLYLAATGRRPLHFKGRTRARPGTRAVTGVGSILRHMKHDDIFEVWGSGIISEADTFARPRAVHAVRGPLSRARMLALGYECPEIYGDPAILMPMVLPNPGAAPRHEVGVIPHYTETAAMRAALGDLPGLCVIDVSRPVHEVIAAICACRATLSSSLHGLILSHAYGVPSTWIAADGDIGGDGVKFLDYLASVGETDIAGPAPLPRDLTARALAELARSRPVPDQGPLRAALWAACPFRPDRPR